MIDKNSWNYKAGFGFYATNVEDETYEFTNLLECVEDKLNNTLHDQPIEECFPMVIGAGDTEHENIAHLADDVAQFWQKDIERCAATHVTVCLSFGTKWRPLA